MADAVTFQTEGTLGGLKARTTASGSAKIRNWNEEIKRQALFSARTTRKAYLDELKKRLQAVAARKEVPAVATHKLKATLATMGYTPQAGFPGDISRWHGASIPPAKPGSITDLSSQRRINLIIDTNIKQAQSMGQISTSDNPVFLMANPAWRLTRVGSRKKPRKDWEDRWAKAGAAVGWKGALRDFVALKDSPIWEALGNGAGGYGDTLGSDYPPYAFGSGMGWVNVGRREWKAKCAAAGVPDQLEGIVEKARALKRAQEAVGGKGAYGESAVAEWKQKAEAAAMTPEPVAKPVFHAELGAMDPVRAGISAVRATAKSVAEALSGVVKAVADAMKAVDDIETATPGLDLSVRKQAVAAVGAKAGTNQAEVMACDGEAVKAFADMNAVPTPSDEDAQASFDLKAKDLAERVKGLEGRLATLSDAAKAGTDALEAEVEGAKDDAKAWVKAECQKIVDEAKRVMDGLKDDAFETLKDEFAQAKKDARKAGRL